VSGARIGRLAFVLAFVAAAVVALGCTHAEGRFHAEGPKLGNWTLTPNACLSAERNGIQGADLFRNDPREDTEIVVASAGFVLARVPGANKMIAFTHDDCRVLDVQAGWNGVRINGVHGISGSAHIECERVGVGKIEGYATFSCN
jgi:hypothetical protein